MKKKNIIVLVILILMAIFISYFMFASGVTNKLKGELSGIFKDKTRYTSSLPVITFVANSSGERLVNDDVAITVNAISNSKITSVEYSLDRVKWIKASFEEENGVINAKITFKNSMNSDVYIKVKNEDGNQSYYYKTRVMIDKEKPIISVDSTPYSTVINLSDNFGLSYLQYSNDKLNWENEELSGDTMMSVNKLNLDFSYVRVVDKAGNISDVKMVNK